MAARRAKGAVEGKGAADMPTVRVRRAARREAKGAIDTTYDENVTVLLVADVEGVAIYINDRRVAGPKPWAGGVIRHEWIVSRDDILNAMMTAEHRTRMAWWRSWWRQQPDLVADIVVRVFRAVGPDLHTVAAHLGVTPRTLRRWLREKPELQTARKALELAVSLEIVEAKK